MNVTLKKSPKPWYKLKDSSKKRRLGLKKGINYEKKKRNLTTKQGALSKKRHLNVLRIYQKKYCDTITKDMKYLDKTYKLGKTNDICKKLK